MPFSEATIASGPADQTFRRFAKQADRRREGTLRIAETPKPHEGGRERVMRGAILRVQRDARLELGQGVERREDFRIAQASLSQRHIAKRGLSKTIVEPGGNQRHADQAEHGNGPAQGWRKACRLIGLLTRQQTAGCLKPGRLRFFSPIWPSAFCRSISPINAS